MKKDTNKDSKDVKPAPKKLSLDKETLRSLTADELDQVQGGSHRYTTLYESNIC